MKSLVVKILSQTVVIEIPTRQECWIVEALWNRGDLSTFDIAVRMSLHEAIVDRIVHNPPDKWVTKVR